MWRTLFPIWVLGCAGDELPTIVEHEIARDDAAPDLPVTFEVTASVEEHGERHCGSPSARESRPLFSPPVTGDFAGTQVRGTSADPTGWGMSVADFDGDGHLDLFLPQKDGGQLYLGRGNGAFDFSAAAFPPGDGGPSTGSSAADIDADGDLDLFVAQPGPDRLLRNDRGVFTDITPEAMAADRYDSIGGAWADYDIDGDLDLFVPNWWTAGLRTEQEDAGVWAGDPNVIWANDEGTFVDRAEQLAGTPHGSIGFTYIGGWWDVNGDRRPELHVVNDKGSDAYGNTLLTFGREAAYPMDTPDLELAIQGMGLGEADLNADDAPDFLVSDWGRLWLMLSDGDGGWYDASLARGLALPLDDDRFVAWGAELADVDNDGDHDAVVAFGPDDLDEPTVSPTGVPGPLSQPDGLWIQGDDGTFVQEAESWEYGDRGVARGFVLADLDGNGWLDFVRRDITGGAEIHLQACGAEAWLLVDLSSQGPNPDGVGAVVELRSEDRRWTRTIHIGSTNLASSAPPVAHFGLGDLDTVDLRVTWPDGGVFEHTGLTTRQAVTIWRE